MTDLNLKTFNKLYPMMIRKYSDLIVDQNASEKDKINSIILKLNALGKLSNDVVRDWNTVYQWTMNDGLTQDVNNKLEDMLAKGQLKSITDALVAEIGDLTTLTTPQKDTVVHSINSLQSEVTTNTTQLVDIVHINSFSRLSPETDDSGRLQRAITQADGKNPLMFNPNVTYQLSGTLTINTGLVLIGNGATLIGGIIKFANTCLYGSVSGFTLDATILSIYSSNIEIKSNFFKNTMDNAIGIIGDSTHETNNITISFNRFENVSPASGFYNSSGRAVYQNTTGTVRKISIIHNRMDTIAGGSAVFLQGKVIDFDISDNIIRNTDGFGIELYNMDSTSNGKVKGNQISYIGVLRTNNASGVGCCGIYGGVASGTLELVDVTDNHIDHVYEVGIEGSFGLVQGNKITYTGYDNAGHPTPSREGIYDGLNVLDNLIKNSGGHGIRYQAGDANGVVGRIIKGNIINNDTLNASFNGIDIRTQASNQPIQNIIIEDNHIEGFDSAIYLMNNNNYSGNQFKSNVQKNCNRYFHDANGKGIDVKQDGYRTYYFQNDTFINWTDVTTLTNWTVANGTLSQVADGSKNIVKITATDSNKGRIQQKIQTPMISRNKLLYVEFVVEANTNPLINIYPINTDGSLNYGGGYTAVYNNFSSTSFQTIGLLYGIGANQWQIEIGTNGIANDWVIVREVKTFIIDKETAVS